MAGGKPVKTSGSITSSAPVTLDDFSAQDDLRTLARAEEIRSDSRRVRHAQRHLRKQTKLLTRTFGKGRSLGGRR